MKKSVIIISLIISICFICSCGKDKKENNEPDTSSNQKRETVIKDESTTKKGKFDYDIMSDSIKRSKKIYETDSVLIYQDTSYKSDFGKDLKLTVNIFITIDLREQGINEKITKIELIDEYKKTLQSINSNDSEWFANVTIDDYNFDGFKDLYIYDGCVVLGNCSGLVMLYDKSGKNFIRAKEFDNLTTINLYPEKKLISSFNRSGGGIYFTYQLYKYIDSKLTLFEEEEQTTERNNKTKTEMYRYTRKKLNLNNNKMVEIFNSLLKEPKLGGDILDDY